MRILILANNDIGLYNFRKELIERLINEENEVYISLPYGEKVKYLVDIGCTFLETNIDRRGTNIIKDFKLLFTYNKIIKQVKPDIVLTYTVKPNIYGGMVCSSKNIPYICNITGLGTATENESLIQKLIIFLYKIALRKVKCCFIQNKENLEFMIKNKITSNERYKLIPGSGVNLAQFKVLDYPAQKDKIKFLFISRVMEEKGIDQFLDAAKYIVKKYTNTEFHILGFCEQDYDNILKELEEKNIIHYHGLQNDVIPYLKEATCLIHPSYYPEGMSNVLLEASACGRPVITTNRSGCREIVEDCETGFIVEIKNTEQLIKKIEQFIDLPYEEKINMGKRARKKVEKEFDRNIVIQKYLEEINS